MPGGQLLRTLQGHTGSVYTVAISPDGRTVGWLTGVHRDLWKDGEISFLKG